jgi:hypothetical protein
MWPYRLIDIASAALLAALAPALVVTCLSPSIKIMPWALGVTLASTLFLGLPCFVAIELKRGVNTISAIVAGFAVGAVPFGVLGLLPKGNYSASTNNVPTIVNGIPTLAGWIEYLELLLTFGALGALAGLVFWLTLKWCGRRTTVAESAATRIHRTPFTQLSISAGTFALAVLLATGVFAIPDITKDRTCHNMFRDGRTSVGSQVSMNLAIGMEDWPKLTEIFERFGTAHGLSFKNSSQDRPNAFRDLELSLCTDQGADIVARDPRWASKNFESIYGRGTFIAVYELRGNSGWQHLAADFLADVEAVWPGKVVFRNGKGQIIPRPEGLRSTNTGGTKTPASASPP